MQRVPPRLYHPPMPADAASPQRRPAWLRALWMLGGVLSLATGIVGIFVPLMPTTVFILIAAWCFGRGSERWERWLLTHPRFGPIVHDWRETHAMPLRAKQAAWASMTFGSAWAAWMMPVRWCWVPAACCACVAFWMWRLPTRPPTPPAVTAQPSRSPPT